MPIYGIAPFEVSFVDTSGPTPGLGITSWSWSFGDGSSSTDQYPTHTYSVAGTYVVVLTITTSVFGTVSFSDVVHIGSTSAEWTQPAVAYTSFPGADPVVILRVSNDGGKTWLPEQMRRLGKAGEYLRRVRWNRLGQARRRVFEVIMVDPSSSRVVGAYFRGVSGGPGGGGQG